MPPSRSCCGSGSRQISFSGAGIWPTKEADGCTHSITETPVPHPTRRRSRFRRRHALLEKRSGSATFTETCDDNSSTETMASFVDSAAAALRDLDVDALRPGRLRTTQSSPSDPSGSTWGCRRSSPTTARRTRPLACADTSTCARHPPVNTERHRARQSDAAPGDSCSRSRKVTGVVDWGAAHPQRPDRRLGLAEEHNDAEHGSL